MKRQAAQQAQEANREAFERAYNARMALAQVRFLASAPVFLIEQLRFVLQLRCGYIFLNLRSEYPRACARRYRLGPRAGPLPMPSFQTTNL